MKRVERKNTAEFNIFGAVIVLILIGLTIFVVSVIRSKEDSYVVPVGSTVYDENNEYILIEDDAKLYKKGTGVYYLKTKDKEVYTLGTSAVVRNGDTKKVWIYGDAYEVASDGSVTLMSGANELKSTDKPGLYKLADRKYLMTGATIVSTDGAYTTNDYVYITIFKSGTAVLMNDEANQNIMNPIMLVTGDLFLDISSEYAFYD